MAIIAKRAQVQNRRSRVSGHGLGRRRRVVALGAAPDPPKRKCQSVADHRCDHRCRLVQPRCPATVIVQQHTHHEQGQQRIGQQPTQCQCSLPPSVAPRAPHLAPAVGHQEHTQRACIDRNPCRHPKPQGPFCAGRPALVDLGHRPADQANRGHEQRESYSLETRSLGIRNRRVHVAGAMCRTSLCETRHAAEVLNSGNLELRVVSNPGGVHQAGVYLRTAHALPPT
jgi:hypothetical protein